jgi:uncharacterized protein
MNATSISTVEGTSVARFTRIAASFRSRLVGLLNRSKLAREEGLLISPGGTIHTFGMRFAIDAVFLDRHMNVLKVAAFIPPWRGVLAPPRTCFVLELAAGRTGEVGLRIGTQMRMS